MPLTTEDVERIAAELKALPPIANKQRPLSKQDAIKLLAKDIAALQQRGYGLDQIAALLSSRGLELTAPTLKSYLQRAKAGKKSDTPRRRRRPVTPPAGMANTVPEPVRITDVESMA